MVFSTSPWSIPSGQLHPFDTTLAPDLAITLESTLYRNDSPRTHSAVFD
jgi:hypothetical protein